MAVAVATLAVVGTREYSTLRGSSPAKPSATSAVPASPTSAVPASPTGTNAQPTATDLENFVREYYALLPGQPAAAWAMLGDDAQAASGGYQSYVNFYNSLDSVSFVEPPVAVDARTVRATLRFVPKDGGESIERYRFTVEPGPNGKLMMSSFTRG